MDQYEVNFGNEQPEENTQHEEAVLSMADQPEQPAQQQPEEKTQPPKYSPFADSPYEMHASCAEQTAVPRKPKKKCSAKAWKTALACLLAVALVAAGCGITAAAVNSHWNRVNTGVKFQMSVLESQIEELKQQIKDNSYTGNGNSVSGTPNTNPQGLTPGQVYAQCVDSVVAITARVSTAQGVGLSSGSGFIISEDGYIVSNYHVVEGATSLSVTTHSGEQHTAALVGFDDSNDFALLKVETTGLKPVALGSSADLIVGDQVVAIGNPLGELSATLTVGYVSGKDRTISTDGTAINMIQTDAAINSGNSGGPLFNMKGEVVGITTAKYSGTTSSGASIEGIGFAIPIDDVEGKIEEIQQNGYVSAPYMGVEVTNQFDGVGIYVSGVEKGGAAEAAGMKPGDLIIKMGDIRVTTLASLTPAMKGYKVGDTTTVTVLRGDQVVELTLTFGEKPHADNQTEEPEQQPTEATDEDAFKDFWDSIFGGRND